MAGKLVIIGGAEDRERHCTVLRGVLELSGEASPQVAVIAAASASPEETGEDYEKVFSELGAGAVRVLKLRSRVRAFEAGAEALIREAAVIFLTGGDQLRLTSTLGGTPLFDQLQARFRQRVVVAGTSAGASAISGTMIVGGSSRVPPQRGVIQMSPGLGLLPGVLIDQHFAQRGRFGRLMAAVALNPALLGLGVDEDTAAVVTEGRWLKVIGASGVTVVDGSPLQYSPVSETDPRETLSLSSFRIHILAAGARFDLAKRELFPVDEPRSGGSPEGDPS